MGDRQVRFSGHALRRMFERGIAPESVRPAIADGTTIECYRDDERLPSRLICAAVAGQILHVVVAEDEAAGVSIVVTAYVPDPALWEPDWKTRRP